MGYADRGANGVRDIFSTTADSADRAWAITAKQATFTLDIADITVPAEGFSFISSVNGVTNVESFARAILDDKVYIEVRFELPDASIIKPLRGQLELDFDDDGLTDRDEAIYETDPLDRDSDDDGLLDGEEINKIGRLNYIARSGDPKAIDSDADGLADGVEADLMLACLMLQEFSLV